MIRAARGAEQARSACRVPPKPNIEGDAEIRQRHDRPVPKGVSIAQFSSVADAKAVYTARHDGSDCGSFTLEGTKYTVSPASFPTYGDGSFALHSTTEGAAAFYSFTLVGPSVIQVTSAGIATADIDLVVDITSKQVNQYKAAASSCRLRMSRHLSQ